MDTFDPDQFNILGNAQEENLPEVPQNYGPSKGFQYDDYDREIEKQNHLMVSDEWEASRGINSFYPGVLESNQVLDNTAEDGLLLSNNPQGQQSEQLTNFTSYDDLNFDKLIPPFQLSEEKIRQLLDDEAAVEEGSEINEAKRKRPYASSSLHILKCYANRANSFRRLNVEKIQQMSISQKGCNSTGQKLSTNAILRLAAQKFIERSSKGSNSESSVLSHPYANSFCGLSEDDAKAVQLVQYLLASAEKVREKQFERASKLLLECDMLCSDEGNPIERLVYYYSGALQERIDRETGTVTPKGLGKVQSFDILDSISRPSQAKLAFQKLVPFGQVSQLAGIQAVLDRVADATKVHIIDLEIRTGIHYSILMQALASRSQNCLEYLTVTAVGTKSKADLEKTGSRVASFAQAFNLKFSFKIVMVAGIQDLNESLFELKADEAVAVWIEYYLTFMLAKQDRLESLMDVVKAIKPRIMIVIDVEGNHNSPDFVTRFIESLFYYGAFYDCLEDCLKHEEAGRYFTESILFSQAIRNIVATEGDERTIRHVAVNVWKAFFIHFGMVQVELSMSSVYQANFVRNNFKCGSSCTLDMDGKSLIIGWKGTPVISLSAWKPR